MDFSISASFLALILATLITPIVIAVYKKNHWIDDPSKQQHPKIVHTTPIPRGGGLVIFFSVLIASVVFLPIDKHMIGILLGAGILTILGFLDDVHNLSPYLRLPLLFLPALCVVGSGIGIAFLSNPFGTEVIRLDGLKVAFELFGSTRTIWVFADILAIIWIVWTMTIVNWSKGLDGQMPGFVGIAAVIIGILSTKFSSDPAQWNVQTLAWIVAGAFFGFLLWNMYPQKIMAGYGAGSLAGYFLAVLAILSGAKVATALLVLAIPTVDAASVIIRRIVSGKSPFWGDRGHLHHRLLDLGWGKRKIAVFYWMSTLLLGILALNLNSRQKFYTILALFMIIGGILTWLTLFFSSSKRLARDNG